MKIKIAFEGSRREVDIDKDEVIVGRPNPFIQPDVDLTPDVTVSRTHARVYERDGWHWIEDLASKYGTLVNGVKQDCKRRLNRGDAIRIGETDLEIPYPEGMGVSQDTADAPNTEPETSAANLEEIRIDTALNLEEATPSAVAESPGLSPERMAVLLDLPLQFAQKQDLKSLLQYVVDKIVEFTHGADRGAVVLRNRDNHQLEVRAWTGSEQPAVSSSLAERAMTEGRALIWRRIVDGVSSESMQRLEIKTGMYAPMMWQGRSIGVLCVDNPRRDSLFTEEDLRLLLAVANYAAMAVANYRLRQDP